MTPFLDRAPRSPTRGGLRSRRRVRKAAGRAKGPAAEELKGRIRRQQINLAMVMSRYGDEAQADVARQRQLVLGLKSQDEALGMAPVVATAGRQPPRDERDGRG